jgi:hypothetical protein
MRLRERRKNIIEVRSIVFSFERKTKIYVEEIEM